MRTMVKTGLVTVGDFIRGKVVWLLTSNVIYRLWKKGDELDLRYETLYQEVRARRVKLLILALCVIACTAQLMNIAAKYLSKPVSTEYHARVPDKAEMPVVIITFDQTGIATPDDKGGYSTEEPVEDIPDATLWWWEWRVGLSGPDRRNSSSNDDRSSLGLFAYMQQKLMREPLEARKRLEISTTFWQWMFQWGVVLRCRTHRGDTCRPRVDESQQDWKILEDTDQPGFTFLRTAAGDFRLMAYFSPSSDIRAAPRLYPDLAIAFFPRSSTDHRVPSSIFNNVPLVSLASYYMTDGLIPGITLNFVSKELFANATFLWTLPGESFRFLGPNCERSVILQRVVMKRDPASHGCTDVQHASELQCVLKATMSRYIAARGNSLALCRLPWVPLSMIAEVKSWNLGNNKTSIAGECTSNNTAQYTASLEEFHWQLLWKIVSNKVSCNTKPCTELEYRVIRATDSCQTWSFQGAQQPGRAEEKQFVVSVNAVEEEITVVFTYGLEDALNDIGGIVGLFFGTSMLTLYEIFERRLFQEESFDVTGKRFRAHRSRARRSNSTEQGLLDATLLRMRLSFGGSTYERRINQLWGLYFTICFCICVWQVEVISESYYAPTPQIFLQERNSWSLKAKTLGLTLAPGPRPFSRVEGMTELENMPRTDKSIIASCSIESKHERMDCNPKDSTAGDHGVWEPILLPEEALSGAGSSRTVGAAPEKISLVLSARLPLAVQGLLFTNHVMKAKDYSQTDDSFLAMHLALSSGIHQLADAPENTDEDYDYDDNAEVVEIGTNALQGSANETLPPMMDAMDAGSKGSSESGSPSQYHSVGHQKLIMKREAVAWMNEDRKLNSDPFDISYISSLWVMESGRPRLFQPTVHTSVVEGRLVVVQVQLKVRKRFPKERNKEICEDHPSYSWTKCCLESFLNGYIRQWYRTAPQTALLRLRETWMQMGTNTRLTSNVGPCYFDWITAYLSHLPNINLYPCSSLANVSLHVSHVAAVLSQQFFNDGALGDLGTRHCNCLPPCDTVESYSTEQYGLLTVRRRQQQTTTSDDDPHGPISRKSSFLTMHVSSAIDEFTDVNLMTFEKLVGGAGGAVGLYLGFSLLSLHEFVEKLSLQLYKMEFRHFQEADGDDTSDED